MIRWCLAGPKMGRLLHRWGHRRNKRNRRNGRNERRIPERVRSRRRVPVGGRSDDKRRGFGNTRPMNPYRHFIGEIVAALQSMQGAGELPKSSIFPPSRPSRRAIRRMATSPPTPPWSCPRRRARSRATSPSRCSPASRPIPTWSTARWRGRASSTSRSPTGSGARGSADCLKAGIAYGDSTMGKGAKVNVEYVSANPTGPLHVAHARGAIVGDALSNLLHKAGYDVTQGILHQRRRRPGRQARPVDLPALPRGAGRDDRARSPRASIPANT